MKQTKGDVLAVMRQNVLAQIRENYSTVEEFCWENDLNKATLSNFLNNKKDFRVSTLVQIASALNNCLEIRMAGECNRLCAHYDTCPEHDDD